MACIILIEHKGLAFFENRLPNFLAKILPIINGTREAANNFNSYMVIYFLFDSVESMFVR